jgi:hypothetical protein
LVELVCCKLEAVRAHTFARLGSKGMDTDRAKGPGLGGQVPVVDVAVDGFGVIESEVVAEPRPRSVHQIPHDRVKGYKLIGHALDSLATLGHTLSAYYVSTL